MFWGLYIMKISLLKILGLLAGVVLIIVVFAHYHLWGYLSLEGFNHYHKQILLYEQHHVAGFTLGYILSYIILISCCIPGTILFDLLAGFIYGPIIGTVLVLGCYTCGAVLNFLLVRYFLKDILHQRFFHLRNVILRAGGMRRTAYNLIGLRFIPVVPFWLLNILAAVLEIPFVIFVITTFIGIIPTSVIYVLLGSGVRNQLAHTQVLSADILTDPKLWVPLIVLALFILLPNLLKMRKPRAKVS